MHLFDASMCWPNQTISDEWRVNMLHNREQAPSSPQREDIERHLAKGRKAQAPKEPKDGRR